jgi:hypothetical protein
VITLFIKRTVMMAGEMMSNMIGIQSALILHGARLQ